MANIIIVNDGTYRWGADADKLLGWMQAHGWRISGSCADRAGNPP